VTSDELEVVVLRVASLLGCAGQPSALLTAAEVASRFGVERSWVYAHARELGVIRLGEGPRPRLRFDPAVVEQLVNPRPPAGPVTALLPIRTAKARRRRRRVGDEERRPRR
jgi:hypothetical protein